MKQVQIIVDSTADMPERFAAQCRIVPLTVHFGSETLVEGVTIDRRRFYERLVESDVLPTTSQATPAAFQTVFEDVARAGGSAVVITLSSKLSGTWMGSPAALSRRYSASSVRASYSECPVMKICRPPAVDAA